MTLEILICTYNDGIKNVPDIVLEPHEDIKWLVSYQYANEETKYSIPDNLLNRVDVSIYTLEGSGLSQNRNNALKHATGDILLIADDDTRYAREELESLLHLYQENTEVEVACLKARTYDGQPLHKYPESRFEYPNIPKGYWYNSQEISFRNTEKVPTFDERFGINAPLGCGEEEVFLWECFQNGLNITYFPQYIAMTDGNTTRLRFFQDKSLQRAKGAVLCKMHGVGGAILRSLKYALVHAQGHDPLGVLGNMLYGIFYIKRTCKVSH